MCLNFKQVKVHSQVGLREVSPINYLVHKLDYINDFYNISFVLETELGFLLQSIIDNMYKKK